MKLKSNFPFSHKRNQGFDFQVFNFYYLSKDGHHGGGASSTRGMSAGMAPARVKVFHDLPTSGSDDDDEDLEELLAGDGRGMGSSSSSAKLLPRI